MPSYEFRCRSCGQVFEKVFPLNGRQAGVRCPSGHRKVRRVYSTPSVLFTGSGFYVTDHRTEPAFPGDKSES